MIDSANTQKQDIGFVDADKSYKLFMSYKWGGGEKNNVYFDEKNRIMFTAYRNNAPRIATELFRAGRKDDAVRMMDVVDQKITQSSYAYNPYTIQGFDPSAYFMAAGYYQIGAKDKGRKVALQLASNLEADIKWILTLGEDDRENMVPDIQRDFGVMGMLGNVAKASGDEQTAKELEQKAQALEGRVTSKINLQGIQQAPRQ